ncbi:hypothetical protein [Actinomycetospora atypica]|uniref:Lipoprotein n=1 Tax=Actinomycetospora atypica TaxID=1290095 RepID=A0ABV9YKK1_9PSEU
MRPFHPALAAALAATAALTVTACSSAPSGPAAEDLTSSKNYSVTQTVTNDTPVTLTVESVTADNGGTVVPGYPGTIGPDSPGTFRATNVGNGVQMKITFSMSNGQKLLVDSDVPRTNNNWSTATLSGPVAGVCATDQNIGINGGDNPAAGFTLQSSKPGDECPQSASSIPDVGP